MYHGNIKQVTKENENFRKVVCTGKYSQLVVMSLKVGEDIGEESHDIIDQIFFIVAGVGEAKVGESVFGITKHDVVFVPAGTRHNIKNPGDEDLKFYTIYSPPAHKEETITEIK